MAATPEHSDIEKLEGGLPEGGAPEAEKSAVAAAPGDAATHAQDGGTISADDDDDDGTPAVLEDPFAGGDDAQPVEVAAEAVAEVPLGDM